MRFRSKNERGSRPPERRPHGLTLEDVRGLIRKPVSYWAIDESGNPSRKSREDGKAFTLSAVTELSPIDYERLLEGVPQYDGEVHFSRLRNEHPDICIRLMTDFGKENVLIVSMTVIKEGKAVKKSKRRGPPVDELYLFSLLNNLVEAISEIDSSDTVIITYDCNDNIRDGICLSFWSDRRIFVLGDSNDYRLIQMADLASSSIGRVSLPDGFAESCYYEQIMSKTVNLHNCLDGRWLERTHRVRTERENGDRPQLNPAFLPDSRGSSEYLTDSKPAEKESRTSKNAKSKGKRPDIKENGDRPQHSLTFLPEGRKDSRYIKCLEFPDSTLKSKNRRRRASCR